MKKSRYVIHFTSDMDGNNRIYKIIIESENEKFAIKKFENKCLNCNMLCITKI